MKNLLMGLVALLVFAPIGQAEIIDAVYLNPSRLADLTNLKVSSELISSGGVNAQTATARSRNSVTVSSPVGYNLKDVSSQKVTLPNTVFQTTKFHAAGGKASFGSGEIQSLKDSAQKMIRVKGETVKVSKNVVVEMTEGKDSSNQKINGLKLGGNVIPQPQASCTGLGWQVRKATDGKEYKVLGFNSCTN